MNVVSSDTANVMDDVVIRLKSAPGVVTKSVMTTLPAPLMYFPLAFAAEIVNVLPEATVVTALPNEPVNVTSSDTAAVTDIAVIRLKLAAAVAFNAVTATFPKPSMYFPLAFSAETVNVLPEATVVTALPNEPVNVTLSDTAAVTVVAAIRLKLASALAFNALTATVP